MSRVFLSHSSRDCRQAMAVKKWLIEQEPGLAAEIFLDLDPHTGTCWPCLLGESWPNTTAKRDATLQVLHGHVRLIVGGDAWDGKTGDYVAIPPQRHALAAVEDSVVMLTVVKRIPAA